MTAPPVTASPPAITVSAPSATAIAPRNRGPLPFHQNSTLLPCAHRPMPKVTVTLSSPSAQDLLALPFPDGFSTRPPSPTPSRRGESKDSQKTLVDPAPVDERPRRCSEKGLLPEWEVPFLGPGYHRYCSLESPQEYHREDPTLRFALLGQAPNPYLTPSRPALAQDALPTLFVADRVPTLAQAPGSARWGTHDRAIPDGPRLAGPVRTYVHRQREAVRILVKDGVWAASDGLRGLSWELKDLSWKVRRWRQKRDERAEAKMIWKVAGRAGRCWEGREKQDWEAVWAMREAARDAARLAKKMGLGDEDEEESEDGEKAGE
ncbi:uncharacterized protein MKK02DRAFT_30023 [Dioszegia hungarica]|uniref:Uncharacterized protein n=1 Tax=Dioszegia hungarica TaxID=4972 RepID=A0AA38LTV5_9TREE|nr:uncharacterized protein MKK02DRAFT_30023 [Dioszegia hungarica]KAI9633046.1 hypothetical protein MKK02DRAFT_30023 [Dioszegia hungarica]